MLNRLRQLFGAGGPSVATTLQAKRTQPGGDVSGVVQVVGGSRPVTVSKVVLGLSTKVCVDGDDTHFDDVFFARQALTGSFGLAPGEEREFPFEYLVPYEAPLTMIAGQRLGTVELGLRTELEVARAFDGSDLDPIETTPLPAQETVVKALLDLGFRILRSDVEHGTLRGVDQTLPFFQEIEFHPAAKYATMLNQLEVTFVAGPVSTQVVLELDRRGGLIPNREVFGRFVVDHSALGDTDWKGTLDDWIMESCRRGGLF
ncbi:sporulation-control protein [Hamadaea flava]|uniref:Sporulation protein n=1 Tax=Hamadaea flava TaxID=1742688 RepID=A0ABV8LJB4_9ACTN|nr:sporulation protein [Hamadaea flava]MCP2324774.1 sporulation-control protein [Hamadaea flava]